jgi:hypothetical protein
LQDFDIVDGQKRVVILTKTDFVPLQFLFDEGVAVEIVGSLEREERRHTHHHRAQRFVTDVEVIMCEATPPASQNAVIGIVGGKPGNRRAERLALFHAFQE